MFIVSRLLWIIWRLVINYISISFCCLFFFFSVFWLCCVACEVLYFQPGIDPQPSAVKAWSLSDWTTREFPYHFSISWSIFFYTPFIATKWETEEYLLYVSRWTILGIKDEFVLLFPKRLATCLRNHQRMRKCDDQGITLLQNIWDKIV